MPDEARDTLHDLLAVMARLRDPATGCSWDVAQDFASIAPYTLDEASEVAAEIAAGPEPARLKDELGDLLLQVVFHARMAEERGWFGFSEVAAGIRDKLLRRHPHVFGTPEAQAAAAVPAIWEAEKARERKDRGELGVLAGIPAALPALAQAVRLTQRAARVGFDWPDAAAILQKLDEEIDEVKAELADADPARLADEVGDMLFVLANLARKLELDPEACLRGANAKFTRRFERVEALLSAEGRTAAESGLKMMEAAWQRAKAEGL